MSTKTLMTVERFGQMKTEDTEDYELVEGELIPLSGGTPRHAKIRGRAERLLNSYFERNPIGDAYGEIDCRTNAETIRRPDLSIFLEERLNEIDLDKIPTLVAPDIAVEVLSPSEAAVNVRRKAREYLHAGSKEVWFLDHANREIVTQTRTGMRLLQESDLVETPLLPGFSVKVADLFT